MKLISACKFGVFASLVLSLGNATAFAHGAWHEQIAAVTAELAKEPGNIVLLLRRADLHRLHSDWPAAKTDIDAAARAGAPGADVAYARAQLAVSQSDWDTAAREIEAFTKGAAAKPDAWRLAGQIHIALREHTKAALAYEKAIAASDPPRPDDVIYQARALDANGEIEEAIGTLDAGLKRLGSVSVLAEEAVSYEEKLGRWDAALTRLKALAAAAPNPARWLARKGDLEEKAGRKAEAEKTRRNALAAIEALPAARRSTLAMTELEQRLRTSLQSSATR